MEIYNYMKRLSILKEEVLYYMRDAWNTSLKDGLGGKWLTTRAIQIQLRERGILTTWPTLAIRLMELEKTSDVESIKTSNGICWKPSEETINI